MNELIHLVTQKTGISEEQAKGAVDTVIGYLKAKLPAPIAGQIDGLLGGASAPQGMPNASDISKGLGDMFSGK